MYVYCMHVCMYVCMYTCAYYMSVCVVTLQAYACQQNQLVDDDHNENALTVRYVRMYVLHACVCVCMYVHIACMCVCGHSSCICMPAESACR
jgi:hypothetical protein